MAGESVATTVSGERRTMNNSTGFWALCHAELAALLNRGDLSGETVRVYLAVADLTRGYQKDRDIISLSQITKLTGLSTAHICRALRRLRELGLYGSKRSKGGRVQRWVIWPPPPTAEIGSTARAGSTEAGSRGTAGTGSRDTAEIGREGTAQAGRHQEVNKKKKEVRKKGARRRTTRPKPINPCVHEIIEFFFGEFRRAHDREFIITNANEAHGIVRNLLDKLNGNGVDPVARLKMAIRNMFRDSWGRDHASFGTLSKQLNKWLGRNKPTPGRRAKHYAPSYQTNETAAVVVDCTRNQK